MPGNFKDQGDTSPNKAQAKAEWIWRRRAGPGSTGVQDLSCAHPLNSGWADNCVFCPH